MIHADNVKHKVRIQKKNGRYYFQHPYARLFVAYFVIFCNFLIYAEDPVSHSRANCTIPLVGNDFAFVTYRYRLSKAVIGACSVAAVSCIFIAPKHFGYQKCYLKKKKHQSGTLSQLYYDPVKQKMASEQPKKFPYCHSLVNEYSQLSRKRPPLVHENVITYKKWSLMGKINEMSPKLYQSTNNNIIRLSKAVIGSCCKLHIYNK